MTTEELRRLLDAATPGPWDARATDDWKCQTAFYVSTIPGSGMQHDGQRGRRDVAYVAASDANTDLIAAAVNALPALLAVVEAAEEWREALWNDDDNLTQKRKANEALGAMHVALDALREAQL